CSHFLLYHSCFSHATATTELYTLSLHDALPIYNEQKRKDSYRLIELMRQVSGEEPKMYGPSIVGFGQYHYVYSSGHSGTAPLIRSEEHTSELQSRENLVCRLLLEKKKTAYK